MTDERTEVGHETQVDQPKVVDLCPLLSLPIEESKGLHVSCGIEEMLSFRGVSMVDIRLKTTLNLTYVTCTIDA